MRFFKRIDKIIYFQNTKHQNLCLFKKKDDSGLIHLTVYVELKILIFEFSIPFSKNYTS